MTTKVTSRRQKLKQAQKLRQRLRNNNDRIRDLLSENELITTKILHLGFDLYVVSFSTKGNDGK